MPSEDEPGTVAWIEALLADAGGALAMEALVAALAPDDAGASEQLGNRLRHSPRFLTLPDGRLALVRDYMRGAFFRYTPALWELERGALRLDGTELNLALAQTNGHPDLEVEWRADADEAPRRTRLARHDGEIWVLPGLSDWYAATAFEPGDDLVVHVRELEPPLSVLGRVPRFERDDGAIARRNHALLEAAIAVLAATHGEWLSLERLTRQLLGRYEFRQPYPPDSFGRRLLPQDNRFTCSRDGREVRLSFFHHDDVARDYLATLGSPMEAMPAFFEEYPPESQADRAKALAHIEALWQITPRPELNGLTPEQAREQSHKIVPFRRGSGGGSRGPS